jgi:hypothetical protein
MKFVKKYWYVAAYFAAICLANQSTQWNLLGYERLIAVACVAVGFVCGSRFRQELQRNRTKILSETERGHCYHSSKDPACMAVDQREVRTMFGSMVKVENQKQAPVCCRCGFIYRGPDDVNLAYSEECPVRPASKEVESLIGSTRGSRG